METELVETLRKYTGHILFEPVQNSNFNSKRKLESINTNTKNTKKGHFMFYNSDIMFRYTCTHVYICTLPKYPYTSKAFVVLPKNKLKLRFCPS